jgi:uncharacterized protein with NAD-binding domain and iron-sulfur cluster
MRMQRVVTLCSNKSARLLCLQQIPAHASARTVLTSRGTRAYRRLPLAERFTMLPWLYSVIDFDTTPESYERYDKMSALDMFRNYGVSKRMYEEFIKPTLLVGLFAPPEELSAGATMGMLYYYGARSFREQKCLLNSRRADGHAVLPWCAVQGV